MKDLSMITKPKTHEEKYQEILLYKNENRWYKKTPQSLNFKLGKVFVANRTEVITILYRKLL